MAFALLPKYGNSQRVLDKKVTIAVNDAELRKVLELVQKQTSVHFVYSPNTIDDSKKVSFHIKEKSLKDFFAEMLSSYGISFKSISENKFLLFIDQPKKTNIGDVVPPVMDKKLTPNSTVTGTIRDSSGNPLLGVTVTDLNSETIAISDSKGFFLIKTVGNTPRLQFKHVGFATLEKNVDASTPVNISLFEISNSMNEVVVIGYGTVKKKDLTGSVATVNMTDLQKSPVRSFEEAMAGRIAGVQVSSADGQPGASVNIVIRGNNSLTQDNSPLYVIDGFPIENPNNNVIDPSEIERIEVLKDASATAIYGARGANGVIIITTKKPKNGPMVISFETYYGYQKNLKEIPLMDPYNFVKYQLESNLATATSTYLKNGKTLDSYKTISGTNWQDELFRVANMANAHLAITGGTKKTKYSISGSAFKQNGIITNSDYKRYQGRAVIDQVVNEKLKVGVNVNYSNLVANGISPSSTNNSSTTGLMYSVWGYRPVTGDTLNLQDQLLDPQGDNPNDYRANPVFSAKHQLNVNTTNTLVANAYADYSINNALKFRASFGTTRSKLRIDNFNDTNTITGNSMSPLGGNGVNGSINYREDNSWVNENILTYNKKTSKYSQLNLVGGCTFQGGVGQTYGSKANHLPVSVTDVSGLSKGTPIVVVPSASSWKLASFLARANYTLLSKYLFTASFRADGSSKFASAYKWGYFPSGAFAWKIGNEKFAKRLTWLSDAKLRTSYGITGNNRVPSYQSIPAVYQLISADYSFNNATPSNGAVETSLGNPNLKWETTSQADIGFDITILNQRIDITTDYYRKKTNDLLLNAPIRPSSGSTTNYKNIGSVQNDGFEFTINTINVQTKNFGWNTSFNISFNRSKVTALVQGQESMLSGVRWDNAYSNVPLYMAKIGQPIAQMIGYVWDGVYQLKDFNDVGGKYVLKSNVPSNVNSVNPIQPGDIKYRDINGDGKVDANDITVIGRPYPKHVGGFTNNFRYKNLDLNIFFQWSYGNDIINLNRLVFDGNQSNRLNLNQFASYENRWSLTNTNTNIYRTGGGGPTSTYSSRVIEDGSYIRLKTVAIGYNFPSKKFKRAGIKTLRIYASGQNLITWTKYSGYDPEVSNYQSALTPGADYSPYPRARTLTVGANVTF